MEFLIKKNIDRYNGPIYRESLTIDVGRSDGVAVGATTGGDLAVGITNGNVEINTYTEYYPGLTLENLEKRHSVETFRQLDIAPTDGILTKDDLKKVYTNKNVTRHEAHPILGGITGGILDLIGANLGCSALKKAVPKACNIIKKLTHISNPKVRGIATLIGTAAILAGGVYLGVKAGNAMADSDEEYNLRVKKAEDEFDNKTKDPEAVFEDMLEPRHINCNSNISLC